MSIESKGVGPGEIELQSIASLKDTVSALQTKIEMLSQENELLRNGDMAMDEDDDFTMGEELELRNVLPTTPK